MVSMLWLLVSELSKSSFDQMRMVRTVPSVAACLAQHGVSCSIVYLLRSDFD